MENSNLYKVTDIAGLAPHIGRLVSMMNYARHTTLQSVSGLTIRELDYLHDENSNTIGSLLLHMASVELGFQIEIFDQRQPNQEELDEWLAAYELGDRGREQIKGNPLEFYLEKMNKVRQRTLEVLSVKNDEWLHEERIWSGLPSNNYFIFFHVYEDEINHRGQIRWLRNRLAKNLSVDE